MASRKQLYESIQAQNARISQLQNEIADLMNAPLYSTSSDKINPIIKNSCDYDIALRAQDEVQATNRYVANIPELNLPSNRLEDMMYRYGSLCFFNDVDDNLNLKVASYSKTGSLNGLGDLMEVTPIDFAGKTHKTSYTVVYNDKTVLKPVIIINDYTGAYREEQIIPRYAINGVSIRDQALVYRKMVNAVRLTALKAIALINDESQRGAIEKTITDFFNNDAPVASIIGSNLNDIVKMFNVDTKLDIQSYLSAIDNFERLRANFNGIKTSSPIEKKERLTQTEAESNDAIREIYLYDGLLNRQIGLELMKKHSMVSQSATWELNPLLKPKKESSNKKDSSKKDDKEEKDVS